MPALNNLIGLSGYARSGKDTVAKILVDNHGFTRVAFADKLREALYNLNPRVYAFVFDGAGEYSESKVVWLADLIDEIGWEEAKIVAPEHRLYLQRLGTEVGRNLFGENVWVDLALRDLDPNGHYVVSDVRFPNEAEGIRSRGGQMVRIGRPGVLAANDHPSETSLDNHQFDIYLPNDGTVEGLADLIDSLVGVAL